MKRILHVVGGMDRAGAETMLMNLYRKLDRESYQFDFVYFRSTPCDYDQEIIALGGRIFRIPLGNPINRMFRLKELILKEAPFHAVHCHMLFSNAFHLYAAKMANISMRIAHSHNTSDKNSASLVGRFYQKWSRFMMRKHATHFIACGKQAGAFLFPKVNQDITYLLNAVDIEVFASNRKKYRDYVHKELNIPLETKIIFQIGRMAPVKNHEFSIGLAKYMKINDKKVHFVFAGGGVLETKLQEMSKANNVEDFISFLGVRSDIPQLMAGSDVLLMPSLHEGFPVVLVESQASGLPALIADTISSEVELGMGMIHFASLKEDFSIWSTKLLQVSNEDEITEKVRMNVLSAEGFNINKSVKKLEELYG